MEQNLTFEQIDTFEKSFDAAPANRVAMNAAVKNGIKKAASNYEAPRLYQHAFSIDVEAGKVTDQMNSGRCWMFASLNVMRLEVMKKLNIENMELSQNYPLFYDKLERANHFLENILDTLDEPLAGRTVSFLLSDLMSDGGQWDMFRSLVAKYGVVPKDVMPESENSSHTGDLNEYLKTKLRGFACDLRTAAAKGASLEDLRASKDTMMETVYRMLAIALGKPPKTFTWETRDKDHNFFKVENITPQDFFAQYVGWDLDSYVTVINAPTVDKPFGKTFTVKYLGNVRGGKYPVKYLNLPIDELKKLAIAQLKDGQTVWFGSDVSQFSDRERGLMTLDAFNFEELFSTDFPMTKAERLDYGESLMTHAMVLTGVDLDSDGKPLRWKVENSWGEKSGDKGFWLMSDAWFTEFTYQILLNRKYLSPAQAKAFEQEPIALEPWDPMGSLAKDF